MRWRLALSSWSPSLIDRGDRVTCRLAEKEVDLGQEVEEAECRYVRPAAFTMSLLTRGSILRESELRASRARMVMTWALMMESARTLSDVLFDDAVLLCSLRNVGLCGSAVSVSSRGPDVENGAELADAMSGEFGKDKLLRNDSLGESILDLIDLLSTRRTLSLFRRVRDIFLA